VTFYTQGKASSYTALCAEAAQAKAMILERYPGTAIVGVERAFFPKIETTAYYNKNLDEYCIIPNSWLEGRKLKDEEEVCSAALKAGVVLKQIKGNELHPTENNVLAATLYRCSL